MVDPSSLASAGTNFWSAPQIVKPVMSVVSAYLPPELSAQRMQRVEHASLIHRSAVVAQEEAIAALVGHELVAQPRIHLHMWHDARMQRHETPLVILGVPDIEYARIEIHVGQG